ncbi:MAG: glycoside hydrolase family 38 N-terminal domain-containing protein [Anaerolineae bacterium]
MTLRRCHYVLSTHWDREWYMSFQDFRYRLVQLIDRVLAGWEDGRLLGPFQTDGQVIVLEDYLEIRPERRGIIEKLVREKKFVLGPWYVLPDEFLVSGESLVRNLRLGRQVARSFGAEPSNAGFVCDLFGHNSQLPQIYRGFGIEGAFVWRGINQVDKRHFIWRSPDGSDVLAYRFGHVGYCSYCAAVRQSSDASMPFDGEQCTRNLSAFLAFEASQTEIDPVLLFDGGDHQEWDPNAYSVLQERMAHPDDQFEVVHTDLDAYLAEALAQKDRITTIVEGELREPASVADPQIDNQWLIPGVLSSRVWIRLDNAACQSALCSWAEPMNALANVLLQREYPQGYLDVAWRWLIQNHPHDSICGCSIDSVHEDMKYRFSQCRGIADRLTIEATTKLAANVAGSVAENELRVVVFNPLARPLKQTVELTLEIPVDWPSFNEFFGFEPKPSFRIYDSAGMEIPYQRLSQAMNQPQTRIAAWHFPQGYRTHHVGVSLALEIPALGYTTLTVRAGERDARFTRYPSVPGLATSECSMANEYLKVTIEPNGTLTITDKRTSQVYQRLLTFEDTADIGDGWYHGQAVNDESFVSTAARSDIALVHNGPMLTTFRVRTTMSVPTEFDFRTMRRSSVYREQVIDSLISLRPGCARLEVQTTINNQVKDHRVRVLLPSHANTDTYLADSPFDVVCRPIALRQDNHTYREMETEAKAQQSWTAVHDADHGLAVISNGLLESTVRDLPDRPIAMTLFRGTRRTVGTTGEPNGQMNWPLTFNYWIVPLLGAPDRASLFDQAQLLLAGVRTAQLRARDVAFHRSQAEVAPQDGLLEVSSPLVVTSVCQVGAALEVRQFNPEETPVTATIHPGQGVLARYNQYGLVNLESVPSGTAVPVSSEITLQVGAKQIRTIRFS